MDSKTKFFRCHACSGNFPVDIKVLYKVHQSEKIVEICEYCWDEENEGLRKIEE